MAKNKNASSRKNKVTIQIILNSGIPLESINSNTHKLSQRENASNQYFVQLANENTIADRDFVLRWKPIPARKPRAALFTEQKFGENYLSLMVLPPAQDFIEQQTLPRESIFVIDTSGSMGGESIRQAKQSLLYALDTLTQDDFFNIVEFNSNTRSLFTTAKPVTKSSLNQAKYFVHKLNAGGGTEMRQAMNQALENQNSRNTLRQVFFLTDGAIGNEAQLFDIIESKLGNSRLFTIGIGSAPNTFFMKKAARYGRGTFTYISNANQAADKMTALFEKIRRPQLTHINVQWPQGKQVDMWPKQIPDLYSEEPLWIKAKVEDFQGQLEVSGQLTNGVWQSRFSFDKGTNHPGIATLWAREKIAGIQAQANYGEVTQEEKDSIIKTALKHHLVSRFTSLVAVDKTITRFTQDLTTKMLPLHTPAGSKIQNQSSINYPQTGLDLDIKTKNSLLWILSCFTLLLLLRRFN